MLIRRARRGFGGFPVATVASDSQFASKVAVGIVPGDGEGVATLESWHSEGADVRDDPIISQKIVAFIDRHRIRSVALTEGPIGCSHREGIDYPEGERCPECPYWADRDR